MSEAGAGSGGVPSPHGTAGLRVERVRPDGFDEVYTKLLVPLHSRHPSAGFHRIFEYPWRTNEDYVGLALHDGEEMAGFVGLVFSRMEVAGRTERFCNVTSLVAKESHRAEVTMLLFQLRALDDYTVTNLTCNTAAYRIFSRLGYTVLDDSRTVLYPGRHTLRDGQRGDWHVLHEPDGIRACLGAREIQILDDHLPYAEHLVAHGDQGRCYLVYTIGRRRLAPSTRLHFVSDPEVFARCWPAVQLGLWRRHRAVFAECDSRLLRGVTVRGSRRERLAVPRLFRSHRLTPDQIPNLYSEMVLLNLA